MKFIKSRLSRVINKQVKLEVFKFKDELEKQVRDEIQASEPLATIFKAEHKGVDHYGNHYDKNDYLIRTKEGRVIVPNRAEAVWPSDETVKQEPDYTAEKEPDYTAEKEIQNTVFAFQNGRPGEKCVSLQKVRYVSRTGSGVSVGPLLLRVQPLQPITGSKELDACRFPTCFYLLSTVTFILKKAETLLQAEKNLGRNSSFEIMPCVLPVPVNKDQLVFRKYIWNYSAEGSRKGYSYMQKRKTILKKRVIIILTDDIGGCYEQYTIEGLYTYQSDIFYQIDSKIEGAIKTFFVTRDSLLKTLLNESNKRINLLERVVSEQ